MCARCGRAGVAQAGGTGPAGLRAWFARWWARRLQLGSRALVVVALGGNCVGAVGFGQSRRLVRAAVRHCAAGLLILAAVALRVTALRAESRPAAAALVPAAWTGQSLSARQSIGRRAGLAGHGRDADSRRLSDAGLVAARHCARLRRPSCPIFS